MSSHALVRLQVLIVVSVLAVVVGGASASAATRQVATNGADAGDCTGSPCATFTYAYGKAASGDVINVAPGTYGAQSVPSGQTKAVTFKGAPGAVLRALSNDADGVTFDGLEVDANFAQTPGFGNDGANNVTFKNGKIGNITDEKGALISGDDFTFDNVYFHDVHVTDPSVHNECIYAIGVPGMTVRNSTFHACATMDLFFTYGSWWSPAPPAYGHITVENNVFAHSTQIEPDSWHAYSMYVGQVGPAGSTLDGWTVRSNTFEIPANMDPPSATGGSRWTGNLGAWTCTPGLTFRSNVGDTCAGSGGKKISPAQSTASSTAPFGWVDPSKGDFHLKSSSPAIGAVAPGDATAYDRDGKYRDAAPDAGAYEYGVGGTPPTPPATPSGPSATPTISSPASRSGSTSGLTANGTLKAAHQAISLASLSRGTICRRATKSCPSVVRLAVRLKRAGRVVIRVQRIRSGHAARTVRTLRVAVKKANVARSARLRARGLRAGSYRLVIRSLNGKGKTTGVVTLRLRVR